MEIIYKKIFTAIMLTVLPIYIGVMIVHSNFSILIAPLIIILSFILVKNTNLAILFFILSPLYPNIFSNAFNLPILNDLMFFFLIGNVSLLINLIFNNSTNDIKIPKIFYLLYVLVVLVVLVGAIRAPLTQNISLSKSLISNFGKSAIIMSILFYSFYFFKQQNDNWVYIIALLFYMILGDYFYDKIIFGTNYYYKMNSGYLGSGNNIGNILVVSLPFLFQLGHLKKKILVKGLPYLAIIAIFLSGSRGSIVAVTIMIAIYIFSKMDIIYRNKAVLLSIIIVLTITFSGPLSNIINDATDNNIQLDSMTDESIGIHSSGRFTIWSRVFRYLNDSPIRFWLGGGSNDFLNYSLHNTQNHVLKTWVDYGLIGLIIELFFLSWTLYTCIQQLKANSETLRLLSKCLIFTTIGFSSVGMFSHFSLGSQELTTFWILIGWLLVEKEIANETKAI